MATSDEVTSVTLDCGCRVFSRSDRVAAARCGLHSTAPALKRVLETIVRQLEHEEDLLPSGLRPVGLELLHEARGVLRRAGSVPEKGLLVTCCGQPLEDSHLPHSSEHEPDGGFQLFNLVCEICGGTYNISGAPGEEEAEVEEAEPTQRVPCPECGLPVSMPVSWDGRRPEEAMCNACSTKSEG